MSDTIQQLNQPHQQAQHHHQQHQGQPRKGDGKFLALRVAIISLAWLAGFLSRLFAVIRFESIIHEFDPWFNYRATHYMAEHGWYDFLNWFDERAWYPLGRIVGGTTFPGLMIVSGTIHYALQLLNITVHIRNICVFLAPIFSGLTAIATYFLTKELWNDAAGLFAASFVAIGKNSSDLELKNCTLPHDLTTNIQSYF